MLAAIYHAWDAVRVEEVPVPRAGPGEIVVRVVGCGLCGSDLLKITSHAAPPVTLGHELSGVISEIGAGEENFAVGQRVVVAHHVPCGTCWHCQHDSPSMCAQFKATNIEPCGFAEFVRVSPVHVAQTTLSLPEALSDQAASFTEPLACCVRAVGRSRLLPGDRALVVGLGAMGLLMAQAIRALIPDARVLGVDIDPERLTLARELGFEVCLSADLPLMVRESTDGHSVDATIVTAGGASAELLTVMRDGGTMLLFGAHPGMEAGFDLFDLYRREMTLTSSYSSSPRDLRVALELLISGRVEPTAIISHTLSLSAFPEALELALSRRARKVYIAM